MCAAGLRAEAFVSYQLYDHLKNAATKCFHFEPVSPEVARATLAALVEDLQVVRELQLPAVAAFHWWANLEAVRLGKRNWAGSFVDSLETVSEKGFLASRYGPVRGVEDFPVPDDATARELIDRRFGLYLQTFADVELTAKGEGGRS